MTEFFVVQFTMSPSLSLSVEAHCHQLKHVAWGMTNYHNEATMDHNELRERRRKRHKTTNTDENDR